MADRRPTSDLTATGRSKDKVGGDHDILPDSDNADAVAQDKPPPAVDMMTALASEQDLLPGQLSMTSPIARTRSQSDSLKTDVSDPTVSLASATASTSSHHIQAEYTPTAYSAPSLRPTTSRRSLKTSNTPGHSSSGSLQTLAERVSQDPDAANSVKRAASTRVRQSLSSARRHSKSQSISQPIANLRRLVNNEHPVYPEQSLASLSPAFTQSSQRPYVLRSRSSHPAQNGPFGDVDNANYVNTENPWMQHQTARTAGNTPLSSPGLFAYNGHSSSSLPHDALRPSTPALHHLQTPRETHAVEIDHDGISGNKILNNYEMLSLIGRGEYGKVKLGRHLTTGEYVAIKIVPRYSRHRRLNLEDPKDQTRREIAILKKARHPNIVSLLELIDDPSKGKVYLILEYVDKGELKWRRRGVKEFATMSNARFQQESIGKSLGTDTTDHERWLASQAVARHIQQERARRHQPHSSSVAHYYPAWDIDEENEDLYRIPSIAPSTTHSGTPSDTTYLSRNASQDDYARSQGNNQLLAGSMYGPYVDDAPYLLDRKFSIATAMSHMSSEFAFDHYEDEELSYVPAITLSEARKTIRSTLKGLEFLHAVGIIHRDIKPANLLKSEDGVKISDFGVSYYGQPLSVDFDLDTEMSTGGLAEDDVKPLDDERELARSVGTPGFWAPELCYDDTSIFHGDKAPKITGAIDLWALGITLYAMIYARLPFYGDGQVGLHYKICMTEAVIPSSRLAAVDPDLPEFVMEHRDTMDPEARSDYELRMEIVPPELRDLIKRLLVKDPTQRITISQAKQHPWILEDLEDSGPFLTQPEMLNQENNQPLRVNDDDISGAMTKRTTMLDDFRNGMKSIMNVFKTATGRKRGVSTSSNAAASASSESVNSPSGSIASTVGKAGKERGREARRTSLHDDELVSVLQRTRGTSGHPLAQSQTASPDNQELPSYFPQQVPEQDSLASLSWKLHPDLERPRLPERAISALSTLSAADSVNTIRASQVNPQPGLNMPRELFQGAGNDGKNIKLRTASLWEGATKTFTRLASGDRRQDAASPSPTASRSSSRSEVRASPSLALSHTQASGSIEAPAVLRSGDAQLNARSQPASSVTSPNEDPDPFPITADSSLDAFNQAQETNQRRLIRETQELAEDAIKSEETTAVIPLACPPSPDDLVSRADTSKPRDMEALTRIESEMGEPVHTAVSSVEDFSVGSVTQSASNPSFVATSGASTPPDKEFLSLEYQSHYQSDRYDSRTRTEASGVQQSPLPVGPKNIHTGIEAARPADHQYLYDEDDGEDEEDSDDEEELVMMGGKSKTKI